MTTPQDSHRNETDCPVIILVEPQMGENIGAAARAMMNCGLKHLRLVNPRDGWPNDRAIKMGVGAIEKLASIEVFDTLSDAIADCHYTFATTARPREMVKDVFTAEGTAEEAYTRIQSGQNVGIIFGPERTGLFSDDVSQANAIVTIPLNPEFTSLNLGQAVLLVAYEWIRHIDSTENKILLTNGSPLATQSEISLFIQRFEDELAKHFFFRNEDVRPHVMRNIRSFFGRCNATIQEINTMHGMLSALLGNKARPIGRLKGKTNSHNT